MKKTATAAIIGAMTMALVACGPSEEFKQTCSDAQGEVKKEGEVTSILGMAPVAYNRPNPPKPAKAPKIEDAPKAEKSDESKKSKNVLPTPSPVNTKIPQAAAPIGSSSKGKGSKKSSDDDYVCVKDGKILFEED